MSLPLKFNRPLVVGHRGFRTQYPENTMVAFDAAVKAGAKMIELDVHFTKDHELVVIHDDKVNRTTNAKGVVGDYTLAEIKKMDAGSWFHARFADERIPTLKEVLRAMAQRVMINIEIKSAFYADRHVEGEIETAVMDLIRGEDAGSSVLVSSFDAKMIKNISQFEDSPPIAFISRTAEGMKTVDFCRELKVFSFHPNYRCLDKTLVAQCHAAGIFVFPYNVNTEREYQHSLQMDVDGVIVDDPAGFNQWYLQSHPI